MPLYNLKSTGTVLYSITKFTDDLDVEATYSVGRTACDCPAGARPTCRHRQMLPTLLERVDTAWFYDFDDKSWADPTGEANKPAPADEPEPDAEPHSSMVEQDPLKVEVEGSSPSVAAIKPAPASTPASAFRRRL